MGNELFNTYANNLYDLLIRVSEKEESNTNDISISISDGANESYIKRDNAFLCPICSKIFVFTDPQKQLSESDVSIEHVPPKSMGSDLITLTCKPCNNEAGKVEGKVKDNLEKLSKWHEQGVTKGRVSFGDRERQIGVSIEFDDDENLNFTPIEEISHNEALNELPEHLKGNKKFTSHIRVPQPKEKELISVLHKSAYLIMFHQFGYAYTQSPPTTPIEKQIINPQRDILNTKSFFPISKGELREGTRLPAILLVEEPCKAFCVLFSLTIEGAERPYGVFLPGPGSQELFDELTTKLGEIEGDEAELRELMRWNVDTREPLNQVQENGFAAVYKFWNHYLDN